MALNLSAEERKYFEECLKKAEPYQEDDPILNTFDADSDLSRSMAAWAKMLLERDRREKEAAGRTLEPESTLESERRKAVQDG
ncbi:MAG: hypothetical protein HFF86_03170 [Oscillibacter sp.]|nr:hypothetical protein [Oscillibacter sp.]